MSPGDVSNVTLHVDGACKGNPGHAGIGVRLESDGGVLREVSDYIGRTTNNAAEYHALIRGLQLAVEVGAKHVRVLSDSELMVKQLNGGYRVRTASLVPLYDQARDLAGQFSRFEIRHVPRSENFEADRLANQGIEQVSAASGPDGRARYG